MAAPKKPINGLVHWETYTRQKFLLRKEALINSVSEPELKGLPTIHTLEKAAMEKAMDELGKKYYGIVNGTAIDRRNVYNDIMALRNRMKREKNISIETATKYHETLKRALEINEETLEVLYGSKHKMPGNYAKEIIDFYKLEKEQLKQQADGVKDYIKRNKS